VAHVQPIGWSATSVPDQTATRYVEVLAELAAALAPRRADQRGRAGPIPQRVGLLVWLWPPDPGGPLGAEAGPDPVRWLRQPFEPDDDPR
jgi:hypothetical protein